MRTNSTTEGREEATLKKIRGSEICFRGKWTVGAAERRELWSRRRKEWEEHTMGNAQG